MNLRDGNSNHKQIVNTHNVIKTIDMSGSEILFLKCSKNAGSTKQNVNATISLRLPYFFFYYNFFKIYFALNEAASLRSLFL